MCPRIISSVNSCIYTSLISKMDQDPPMFYYCKLYVLITKLSSILLIYKMFHDDYQLCSKSMANGNAVTQLWLINV